MLPSFPVLMTSPYVAEARALFARFTTPPTTERKVLINNLIKSLLLSGVWAKLDVLIDYPAADSQAARRNWIADIGNMTAVGAPTFVADRGYTGDGASSYLSGLDYSALTKFSLNSGFVAVWVGTSVTADGQNDASFATNATGRVNLNARAATSGAAFGALQSVTGDSFTVASSIGFTVMQRIDASTVQFSKDGGAFSNVTRSSTGAAAGALQSARGSGAGSYSTRRQQAVIVGAPLSEAQVAALYSALNTYMQAVGAA